MMAKAAFFHPRLRAKAMPGYLSEYKDLRGGQSAKAQYTEGWECDQVF
jgi:hypothetical protein